MTETLLISTSKVKPCKNPSYVLLLVREKDGDITNLRNVLIPKRYAPAIVSALNDNQTDVVGERSNLGN